ncbi:HNH endonuclease [Paraburkholderia silvatlantica]|uniref:HNH endonuclease n=1 Tax=Paraburkholderia silvatlantica TaxID=321895 RepID=A0ABR6FYF2_9BURK|nr:HNH endonuclease [Paraburkholderia silvatlantica]MBB2932463.1 hypothetical protein [Paraburkholderia silvatlantica]PVY22356.1 hypothetical protein C7411_13260 [Paraburkholderia silvatlantica]PXW27871.1 hypothetical protein C7413_13360 [Paraburkholderia silvatlantica]
MGIITIIKNLLSGHPEPAKPTPKAMPQAQKYHLNENYEYLEDTNNDLVRAYNEVKYFHQKTKNDAKKYNPALIPLNAEYERQKKYRIVFHFIPKLQNYKNVRSYIQFSYGHWQKWQDLRLKYFRKNNHTCQSCRKKFEVKELELRELWSFDEQEREQKLEALIPLCHDCHAIAHISRAFAEVKITENLIAKFKGKSDGLQKLNESLLISKQRQDELFERYTLYNRTTIEQAQKDLKFAYAEAERRKEIKYQLDLSLLKQDGFDTDGLFDCHSDAFNAFIEKDFKQSSEAQE